MTREEFAQLVHWGTVMWVMGFVNVVAMTPQPLKILKTKNAKSVSIAMFALFFFVQVSVALDAFIHRSGGLMWSMIVSAVLSLTTIALALRYRNAP